MLYLNVTSSFYTLYFKWIRTDRILPRKKISQVLSNPAFQESYSRANVLLVAPSAASRVNYDGTTRRTLTEAFCQPQSCNYSTILDETKSCPVHYGKGCSLILEIYLFKTTAVYLLSTKMIPHKILVNGEGKFVSGFSFSSISSSSSSSSESLQDT